MCHVVLGTIYCWANFLSYLPPGLQFFDGLEHVGQTPDAVQVMPFTLIAQNLGLPLGAKIDKAVGPRLTSLFGCSLHVLGVFLSSFQTRLAPFILCYSLLAGLGVGIVYTVPMRAGWTWFPNSIGLVNGICLFGFGAGALVFNKVGTSFAQSGIPWSSMLRNLAAIYAVISIAGALLIKEKKASSSVVGAPRLEAKSILKKSATFSQALRSNRFKLLWLIGINAFTPGLTVMGLYKQFGTSDATAVVSDDSFLSLVGGLGALSSGCGRLILGRYIDLVGFNRAWTSTTLLQIFNMLVLPLTKHSKLAFGAGVCSSLLCLGGSNAMFITVNAQTFGLCNQGEIYSVLFSAVSLGSLFGAKLAIALLPTIGWRGVFTVQACMAFSNLGLLAILRNEVTKPAPWH
jgi:OFA family oxalate/formate antiporter-like MFS transporter